MDVPVNDNTKIHDEDDAQDRKDEARQTWIELEARKWRGRPDLLELAQGTCLTCRSTSAAAARLAREKHAAAGDRQQHLAEELKGQHAWHRAAARDLEIYMAAMDAVTARRFDEWLKTLPRSP